MTERFSLTAQDQIFIVQGLDAKFDAFLTQAESGFTIQPEKAVDIIVPMTCQTGSVARAVMDKSWEHVWEECRKLATLAWTSNRYRYTPVTNPPSRQHVLDEIARARELFPSPDGLFAALIEEVGELCAEMVAFNPTANSLFTEMTQVVAMCARLAVEGDPTLTQMRQDRRQRSLDRSAGG